MPEANETSHHITELLKSGTRESLDRLWPLVYDELRHLAARQMRRERPDHTLQPTALVHEAWLRLVDQREADWRNRARFFGLAAEMMRRILVNHALARKADKRGGHETKLSLEEAVSFAAEREVSLTLLDEALNQLAALDPELCRIVEMRFFAGLTIEEVAEVMNTSTATVKRQWRTARAWLYQQISRADKPPSPESTAAARASQ
ncbi:MAG: sigma-70 family RNA polymerase sigma factor [Blastocatellia bacterium]